MSLERIAGTCICVVIASAAVAGQQRSETADQGSERPARSVMERTYGLGGFAPWRRVQTRDESGGREVVVETLEGLDVEGRLSPAREVVVETVRTGSNIAQTRRDVFDITDRRRRLLETTESRLETLANGDTSAVRNTWGVDINGRLGLTSRQVERTRSAAGDVRQAEWTLVAPSLNGTLREAERTEYTERRIAPGVVRHEASHLVRDINGRWQPIETRRGERREIGAAERIEEETVHRPDMNGKLVVQERRVTRRVNANQREDEVTETYAPYADGVLRSGGPLALSQRVHRTTTPTADGGRHTVEQVEARSRVAPSDPIRLVRRTVTTVRPAGADRWMTQRQEFTRDVNGRMQLVTNETEERAGS